MQADLYAAIRSTAAASAAYDANDDAAVVAALNAKTVQMRDSTLRNLKWVVANFNRANADRIATAFKTSVSPSVQADYYALVGAGIDLSDADTRDNIDTIHTEFDWATVAPNLRNNLKEKGRWQIGAAMQRIGRDAVIEDIAAVRTWFTGVFQRDQLAAATRNAYTQVNFEIESLTLTTRAQVRNRFSALLP